MKTDLRLNIELEKRLSNWAFWFLNPEGISSKSPMADFGLFTGSTQPPLSKPPFPINNFQADEMNGWINILGVHHPELKEVIKSYYLEKGNIAEKAKLYNIAPRTYKMRLQFARNWLEGGLSIDEENLFYKKRQNSIAECRP